ncbi:hypothetical protein VNI00_008176 [Paramarasmius palmivorus]|uniref:Uncharacterized protein n=1 Tax=Paramarasmius palmivorus TaxID=297713 RepID=A0AAW0CZW6_9AGAR
MDSSTSSPEIEVLDKAPHSQSGSDTKETSAATHKSPTPAASAVHPDDNVNPRKRKTPPLLTDDDVDGEGDEDAEGDADFDMELEHRAPETKASEYQSGHIKCEMCHQMIPFRDPKTGQLCVDVWNTHKKECYSNLHSVSETSRRPRSARSPTPPHRHAPQSSQDPILYTPTSLSISQGQGPPPKRRRAKRTEEERIAYLKSDPYVAEFEAYKVLCKSCDKWIRLRPNSTYCSIPWDAHRKSCLAKKISSKNTYALEERNSLFSKDPDVRKFDAERVLCAACDQWIAINPEDHLQGLRKWHAHKESCEKRVSAGRAMSSDMPYVMHSPEFPPHSNGHGQRSPPPQPLRAHHSPSQSHPAISTVRNVDSVPRSRSDSFSVPSQSSAPSREGPRNDKFASLHRSPSVSPIPPPSTSRSPLISPTSDSGPEYTSKAPVGSPIAVRDSPRMVPVNTNPSISQSQSIQDSRRRNAEQRAATLRADPLIEKVEANRVFCSLCQKWVQLRQDSSFCAYPWHQHRSKCIGRHHRRAQKTTDIADMKARRASSSASAVIAHHRDPYAHQPYPPPQHNLPYPHHPHASSSRYPPSHPYPPPPPPHHRYSRYDERELIDSEEEDDMIMRSLHEEELRLASSRYPYQRRSAPYPPPLHSSRMAPYSHPPPSRSGSYRSQRRAPAPHPDDEDEEDQLHSGPDESDAEGSADPEADPEVGNYKGHDGDVRMPPVAVLHRGGGEERDRDREKGTKSTRFALDNSTSRNRFIHHSILHLFSTTFSPSEDELSVSMLLAYLNAAMPEGKWEDFDTNEVVKVVSGFKDVGKERVSLEGDLIKVRRV